LTTEPRFAAEWEPQGAVMLAWPHRATDWARRLDQVIPVFEHIARAVLRFQNLIVSSEDVFQVQRLQRQFDQWCTEASVPGRALVVLAPSNDTWVRDFGPLTVVERKRYRLLDFRFNAWGNKYPWDKDNAVSQHLARQHAFGKLRLRPVDWVLEGGSVETDGAGTLMTTAQCLLSPARNGDQSRADVEAAMLRHLGTDRVLWLDHGYLEGDDTDSHIDTLARFCTPSRICYVRCDDPEDSHYPALSAMEQELQAFRQRDGSAYELIPLPWPDAIHSDDGERLPATYANFLIINGAVLAPVYDVPQDDEALAILARCFPEREIIAINCRPLIEQHGSLHCLTMQLPPGVWGND